MWFGVHSLSIQKFKNNVANVEFYLDKQFVTTALIIHTLKYPQVLCQPASPLDNLMAKTDLVRVYVTNTIPMMAEQNKRSKAQRYLITNFSFKSNNTTGWSQNHYLILVVLQKHLLKISWTEKKKCGFYKKKQSWMYSTSIFGRTAKDEDTQTLVEFCQV